MPGSLPALVLDQVRLREFVSGLLVHQLLAADFELIALV